jgi:hypothetical protein
MSNSNDKASLQVGRTLSCWTDNNIEKYAVRLPSPHDHPIFNKSDGDQEPHLVYYHQYSLDLSLMGPAKDTQVSWDDLALSEDQWFRERGATGDTAPTAKDTAFHMRELADAYRAQKQNSQFDGDAWLVVTPEGEVRKAGVSDRGTR